MKPSKKLATQVARTVVLGEADRAYVRGLLYAAGLVNDHAAVAKEHGAERAALELATAARTIRERAETLLQQRHAADRGEPTQPKVRA